MNGSNLGVKEFVNPNHQESFKRQEWVTKGCDLLGVSKHFFCKGPESNIFTFMAHIISKEAIQHCHCSMKAALDNT